MSALVCGKRSSSIFDEVPLTPPSASKRVRCSPGTSSPTAALHFSPSRINLYSERNDCGDGDRIAAHLAHLRSLFPEMDQQLLERALEASGDDLDSAIKSLNDLRLESNDFKFVSPLSTSENVIKMNTPLSAEGTSNRIGVDIAAVDTILLPTGDGSPTNGSEWVDLFVREMVNASDVDDARARASRALGCLEKSIMAHAGSEALQNLQKENMSLKEQVELLLKENTVLKRAVSIQHARQEEYVARSQELQHLKQLVSQYQDQVRTLEINNYALTVHLRQAQQSSSMPGRFHPDVF